MAISLWLLVVSLRLIQDDVFLGDEVSNFVVIDEVLFVFSRGFLFL
jgi:hypothetical protein